MRPRARDVDHHPRPAVVGGFPPRKRQGLGHVLTARRDNDSATETEARTPRRAQGAREASTQPERLMVDPDTNVVDLSVLTARKKKAPAVDAIEDNAPTDKAPEDKTLDDTSQEDTAQATPHDGERATTSEPSPDGEPDDEHAPQPEDNAADDASEAPSEAAPEADSRADDAFPMASRPGSTGGPRLLSRRRPTGPRPARGFEPKPASLPVGIAELPTTTADRPMPPPSSPTAHASPAGFTPPTPRAVDHGGALLQDSARNESLVEVPAEPEPLVKPELESLAELEPEYLAPDVEEDGADLPDADLSAMHHAEADLHVEADLDDGEEFAEPAEDDHEAPESEQVVAVIEEQVAPAPRRRVVSKPLTIAAGEPVVELVGAKTRYGRTRVLRGVDLDVATGEVVGVIGPRGCGKTTVLHTCAGMVQVHGGRMLVGGERVRGTARDAVSDAGIVTLTGGQVAFPSLTVRENLSLTPVAGLSAAHVADEVLERFPHLAPHANRSTADLELVDRTILGLAKTLITSPRLIIMDDITRGLGDHGVDILAAVCAEVAATGTAMLIAGRDPYAVLRICDRAVLIQHGQTVRSGTADELTALLEKQHVRERA